MTVEQYVQNVLVGAGVSISNVQYNGGSSNVTVSQVGSFVATNSIIEINSDCYGYWRCTTVEDPTTAEAQRLVVEIWVNDVDLDAIVSPNGTNDACIEFDFVPIGDSVKFNYVWFRRIFRMGQFILTMYLIFPMGLEFQVHIKQRLNIATIPEQLQL